MSTATQKVCTICSKDVSNAKRVKDVKGHYYCEPCHLAAQQRPASPTAGTPAAPATRSVPAQAPAAAPAGDDIDLLPLADAPKPSARPTPQPVAAAGAPAAKPKLPEFCPNCGTKVLANRRICFKCNRDVTTMDKLIELRAKQAQASTSDTTFALWFGRVMRVAMWVTIAGIVVFLLWGIKLMVLPGGLWDNYPKSREAAVREFLADISTGTDKSYNNAFMLISFRERTTNLSGEDAIFKAVFRRMHDDFARKYGSDWLSKIKLENLGANAKYADDEVDFRLTLGEDTYNVATQVQIDTTKATANMTLPRKKKPVYAEDGENHFGILDIAQYQAHPTRHMIDIVGPGQPEDLDLPTPIPPGAGGGQ